MKFDKAYIIGEIGINHNGDIDIAKRLIDIASCAGFNAVKFQKRDPDICVPEEQKNKLRDTPWGKMTYIDYKKKLEFGKREFNEIAKHCKARKIDWSASPWDLNSVDFLANYKLPWVKIASASITDLELVRYCSITFPRVIFSTGMSTEEQIDIALENILRYRAPEDVVILHCNSSYPSPIEDLNLNYLRTLKSTYKNINIGYSGHEYGLTPTISTIAMGAKCIERHITLDKGMWGSDQSCSIEPHAMFKLVRGVRELELALGGYNKVVTADELAKAATLRK